MLISRNSSRKLGNFVRPITRRGSRLLRRFVGKVIAREVDGGGRWRELRGFLRLIEVYEEQVVGRRVKESEEGVEERVEGKAIVPLTTHEKSPDFLRRQNRYRSLAVISFARPSVPTSND